MGCLVYKVDMYLGRKRQRNVGVGEGVHDGASFNG